MSPRPKLVILNPTCLEVLDAHAAYLDATGLDWVASPEFMSLTPDRAETAIRDADALILPASIRTLPSADQMAANPRLKVISIAASGYDWLDVNAATRNGIIVTIAPAR
jgi:phosphoglycerate dehydrogenase-like enzyme